MADRPEMELHVRRQRAMTTESIRRQLTLPFVCAGSLLMTGATVEASIIVNFSDSSGLAAQAEFSFIDATTIEDQGKTYFQKLTLV